MTALKTYKEARENFFDKANYSFSNQVIPSEWIKKDEFDSASLKKLIDLSMYIEYAHIHESGSDFDQDLKAEIALSKELTYRGELNISSILMSAELPITLHYKTEAVASVWHAFVNPIGRAIILTPRSFDKSNPLELIINRYYLLHEMAHTRRDGFITIALKHFQPWTVTATYGILLSLAQGPIKLLVLIYFFESMISWFAYVKEVQPELYADVFAIKRMPEKERRIALSVAMRIRKANFRNGDGKQNWESRMNAGLHFICLRFTSIYASFLSFKPWGKKGWDAIDENPIKGYSPRHWLYGALCLYIAYYSREPSWQLVATLWIICIVAGVANMQIVKEIKSEKSKLQIAMDTAKWNMPQ